MRAATDVGGTFTDYVTVDHGKISAFKTLTTADASVGILERLKNTPISEFSHGTTAAVNAVLERKGVPVVFFTTQGFGELVNIGRQTRINVYSFICEKPQIPLAQLVEVSERTAADGTILKQISEDDLRASANKYCELAKTAVIGFINSYANPRNELLAESLLKEYFPLVVASHKLRHEIREYERFCTAIMEGYCFPVVNSYLENLGSLSEQLLVMQSNGGRNYRQNLRAVNMLMSGPAGGVAATQALCKKLGTSDAIAYDMGGTSADVSAIVNGKPLYSDSIKISHIPLKALTIDIESIGAGGGSIAWVDDGGALKVGPGSAGAHPGPACYDLGGTEFTVSDANLVVGVLGPTISQIPLNLERSTQAAKQLCKKLELDLIALSQGVIEIVNNNMVRSLKRISIGKGYDPRKFTLVAFGGAGPMHACAIAEAIGISRIIIPPLTGAFSALGILSAPVRFDYIRTILSELEAAREVIPNIIDEFSADLRDRLGENYRKAILNITLDMRYVYQGHEINIPYTEDLASRFHQRHNDLFGFDMPENPIEVVNVKMVSEIPAETLPQDQYAIGSVKVKAQREVHPHGKVNVYARAFHGLSVDGPSVIEDVTTTIYVAPSWTAKLAQDDVLHLERD